MMRAAVTVTVTIVGIAAVVVVVALKRESVRETETMSNKTNRCRFDQPETSG